MPGPGAPEKQGLEFFAFQTKTFDSLAIERLIRKHGAEGFLFWMKMKAFILSISNYIVLDDEDDMLSMFRKRMDYPSDLKEVKHRIASLVKGGFFDEDLYKKYKVLTSAEIQTDYIMSTPGRSKVRFVKEYTLIDFKDFQHLSQVIYLQDIKGVLIERFRKKEGIKIDPETKLPLKGTPQEKSKKKSRVSPTKPVMTEIKPNRNAEVDPVEPSDPVDQFTYNDVLNYIRVPYIDQDDVFKETYTEEEYNGYVKLCKAINDRYPTIKKSNRQLTFPEYIEFVSELQPSPQELQQAVKKLSKQNITADTDIYRQLGECIEVSSDTEPTGSEDGDSEGYVRDEKFENKVLSYFGFNGLPHNHKHHVLVHEFCKLQSSLGTLETFKENFEFYMKYKEIKGPRYKHSLAKFLGQQSERFSDGVWDSENWHQRLIDEQNHSPKQQNKPPIASNNTSKAEQSVQSHNDFMSIIKKAGQ
jgi:hypothetical protein